MSVWSTFSPKNHVFGAVGEQEGDGAEAAEPVCALLLFTLRRPSAATLALRFNCIKRLRQ